MSWQGPWAAAEGARFFFSVPCDTTETVSPCQAGGREPDHGRPWGSLHSAYAELQGNCPWPIPYATFTPVLRENRTRACDAESMKLAPSRRLASFQLLGLVRTLRSNAAGCCDRALLGCPKNPPTIPP